MLIYEYQIRQEFNKVKEYAQNMRQKFESAKPDELLLEYDNLKTLSDNLQNALPEEIRNKGNLNRHLAWMKKYLEEGKTSACTGDINDICEYDLPELEKAFVDWVGNIKNIDPVLAKRVSKLLMIGENASVIRMAFVVLTERLRSKFSLPSDIDGLELVNIIFGSKSTLVPMLTPDKQRATRDLLAGLYGYFRNNYGHNDAEPDWSETDAVLSMVNYFIKWIDCL